MASGRGPQIEHALDYAFRGKHNCLGFGHRFIKKLKVRRERRRAKLNPECVPEYGKYGGWDW